LLTTNSYCIRNRENNTLLEWRWKKWGMGESGDAEEVWECVEGRRRDRRKESLSEKFHTTLPWSWCALYISVLATRILAVYHAAPVDVGAIPS
jgi:hypothetical protein